MRRLVLLAFLPVAFATSAIAQQPIVLANAAWQVTVEPATLAVAATPAGEPALTVSTGVAPHAASAIESTTDRAAWDWDEGVYRVELALADTDLQLTITARGPGELEFLRQPAETAGNGLILPLAEGHYVPPGEPTWQAFLTATLGELNTTQDLSLPLWGVDRSAYTLHWILTNPFNNTIAFTAEGAGTALAARHAFTTLDPAAPFTATLHLAGPDLLAGAKRYRAWLVDAGAFETLADKIAASPETAKLIGATHVYLWGSGLVGAKDVRDWRAFLATLRGDQPLAVRLREHMEGETRSMIAGLPDRPMPWQQGAVAGAVDAALDSIARATWQADAADANTLVSAYAALRAEVVATFGNALTSDTAHWGSGEEVATIEAIRDSGLERLWIGLGEGWEGGLWHPEAIRAAVDAGYLIAPYDSYQDALPDGLRADWATAHLGQRAHEDCAVIRLNGTPQPGFQGQGHYTNPDCIRPLAADRIAAIRAASGFNSWFLDSYGAGMLFDDYRVGVGMTQSIHAEANAATLDLVNRTLGLPAGSEDGKATTARGVPFAHGTETPFIGWGDPELHSDQTSPYFLGGWWPGGEPAIFFRRVPLPDRYRTVHFDPRFRLPLYQAVFHDSVIVTHHWSFDSLKFEGVATERELSRLLYNTPALVHLSTGTLDERLDFIAEQDAFFAPLHERLWNQPLTSFRWLSEDRLLQETDFADGTRLVANFAGAAREEGGQSFPPLSVTAVVPGQRPVVYQPELP
jgi:hypothetical protein